jgi:hypothetical protein
MQAFPGVQTFQGAGARTRGHLALAEDHRARGLDGPPAGPRAAPALRPVRERSPVLRQHHELLLRALLDQVQAAPCEPAVERREQACEELAPRIVRS